MGLAAADSITKPFSPRELVARVRAVLPRIRGDIPSAGVIRAGDRGGVDRDIEDWVSQVQADALRIFAGTP